VIPVASAKAVGKPLTETHVHRPERVADLTDLSVGDPIRPVDIAAVLASREGGRRRVPPSATVVPLVNMVDDEDLAATGRAIATEIHDRADVPRVVLAQMEEARIVDVVE
jgi:probable selenium-dependent hydroxylase accessory protein YqeC